MHPTYVKLTGIGALGIATVLLVYAFANPYAPTASNEDDVHVHADFLLVLADEPVDLSVDAYQSAAGNPRHESIHVHDNVGNILHRHAADVTLADFLSSIGFILTDDSLTTDEGITYAPTATERLLLFVNGEIREAPEQYIIQEADRILLYYGNPDSPEIETYLTEITNDACIYSGTCPERGIPPPESCGITCEI